MVKGINRQVIVVRPPDQKLFEQAIFLLRPDAQDSCNVTQDELLRQAQQAAKGYGTAHFPGGRLRESLVSKLVWSLAGGGLVGLAQCGRAERRFASRRVLFSGLREAFTVFYNRYQKTEDSTYEKMAAHDGGASGDGDGMRGAHGGRVCRWYKFASL